MIRRATIISTNVVPVFELKERIFIETFPLGLGKVPSKPRNYYLSVISCPLFIPTSPDQIQVQFHIQLALWQATQSGFTSEQQALVIANLYLTTAAPASTPTTVSSMRVNDVLPLWHRIIQVSRAFHLIRARFRTNFRFPWTYTALYPQFLYQPSRQMHK